jgi:hypothetical protein
MQILRVRRGFQADHSSSSYLFYAADKSVSEQGRRIARRYSSRAEVDKRSVRYQKWGESSLSSAAYKALMAEHYDVMVSESYDWWTLIVAVPQTAETKPLRTRYGDARGNDDLGVDVEKYGSRWAISIYCALEYDSLAPDQGVDDPFEHLVKLLVAIRKEIIAGDFSLLDAVVKFYGADDEEQLPDDDQARFAWRDQSLTKLQLQAECGRRGIAVRKSWSKDQLRAALESSRHGQNLTSAAKQFLGHLGRV